MKFPEKTPQRLFGFHSTEPSPIPRPNERRFTPTDYRAVWRAIEEATAERSFFSGALTIPLGDSTARLVTTLIIYRAKESGELENIVPVWWQMATHRSSECSAESECPNDFSFGELIERFIHPNHQSL